MKKIFNELKNLNKYAKYILLIGILIIVYTFIASIVFHFTAGVWGEYYTFMNISTDLAISARSSAGIICISAFVFQFINIE